MKFKHTFALAEKAPSYCVYECGNICARIDFVSDSAVRVAVFGKGEKLINTFNVNPNNTLSHKGRERLSTEGFSLCTPRCDGDAFCLPCGVKLRVNTENLLLSYEKDEKVLFGDRAPLAYNLENEFGKGAFHFVSRSENEHIYGVGDKGGSLDKAGRAFRIETTDCMGYDASETDPLYKHIPFYICENEVGTYGVFYDTSCTSYLDFGKEIDNYYEPYKYFKTEDNCLVYYVFFGSRLEILQQFSALCGAQPLPPKWSFDYCASTMAYTDAENSSEQFKGFLDKIHETGLSCSGFYLSSGYTSIGNNRYVFNWNTDKFPSPAGFVEEFAREGIHIIPNIKPAFLTDHPMYDGLAEQGLFIKNPDGTPFLTQFWDGLGSYLDFTNPAAFDFWKAQVKEKLLDLGIDATWNDNNEFDIKDCDAVCFSGDRACDMRPTLTYLMVLASYEAQREKYPTKRPFLSTRSGSSAVRRLAQTWSGDNRTAFEDLKYCHNIGLTMSLSSLMLYGHDLGGFTGDMPSRELLLRWLQHGVFEPRFTIHSWNKDGSATMPWSYGDIVESVQALFEERRALLPYLYSSAYFCTRDNIPMNAPPLLYYDDEELQCDTSTMLVGRDILVPFVFDEGETATDVYLPRGEVWYLGDKRYDGGQTVRVEIKPTDTVPYFVRGGSVMPTLDGFTVYPAESGTFEAEFFDDDGESFDYLDGKCVMIKFTVTCDKDTVTVEYKNCGSMPFNPKFELCSADSRRLIVK
ncbi:MAG: DUF5110 domain-containing protein [Eubacterium sp.]|nr:DUF5110 domain-containing protein [Eubacterium sp.]